MKFKFCIFCVLFLVHSSVFGYVSPSFFLIKKITENNTKLKNVFFKNKVLVFNDEGRIEHQIFEQMQLMTPGAVSVRLFNESDEELASTNRNLISENKNEILNRPVLYDLFMVFKESSIFSHLKDLGLPLKSESELYAEKDQSLTYQPEDTLALTRFEDKVATVIAAGIESGELQKPISQSASPQLWFEKESLTPLRAYFTLPKSKPLEFRFKDYRTYSLDQSVQFPKVIEIYQKGILWIKIENLEIQKVASRTQSETANRKKEPNGDLQSFIEKYFQWIR